MNKANLRITQKKYILQKNYTILHTKAMNMAGEQKPGGTRQLGHWLGDQLSNIQPHPFGHYRHEYLIYTSVCKKKKRGS